MAHLVRKFAECAGIEIGERFDGSPWAKPLAAIYRYFDKDAFMTVEYIKKACAYFESKNLSYTPHALWRDLPLIDKWIAQNQKNLDISERRIL